MDAPDSKTKTDKSANNARAKEFPHPPLSSKQSKQRDERLGGRNKYESSEDETDRQIRFIGIWLRRRLRYSKPTEIVLAITAVALTFVGIGQFVIAIENYNATFPLVEYARKQAESAASFATSAGQIRDGIGQATGKLSLQADKLGENASQTGRLADDTDDANSNVIEADRPWMGSYPVVSAFKAGEKPVFAFQFQNSGKRPALAELTAYRASVYEHFPSDPDKEYTYDTTPSKNVIVPGGISTATTAASDVITKEQIDALALSKSTYFAFAKIEYRDIRTGKSYWTHVCIRYMPKMRTETDNGWRNCAEYNDAK